MSIGLRTIASETRTMLNKQVTVKVSSGKKYKGTLAALDPESLHVCLTEAKELTPDAKRIPRLVINGTSITEVQLEESGMPMQSLAEQLLKIYPNNVRFLEDTETIIIADRVRITPDGKVEGVGPIADRVRQIVDKVQRESKQP
ncbi:MAG: Lsm family RNA-binding protein [Candidatus Marsarchaeota archaeon]|nr:Lsm family RNA-binding protein [Candidatus Marsarchaeota archaeon]